MMTDTQEKMLTAHVNPCSGSMEPAFYRGDILFLTNPVNEQYVVGDITVYQVYVWILYQIQCSSLILVHRPGTEIPIVHRVIETHTA